MTFDARSLALVISLASVLVSGCALLGGGPDLSGWTATPTATDPEFARVGYARCVDGWTHSAEMEGAQPVQDQRGANAAQLLWVNATGIVDTFVYRTDEGDLVAPGCGFSYPGQDPSAPFAIDRWGAGGGTSGTQGSAPRRVDRVEIVTEAGLLLEATVGEGRFIAWWPGDDLVASARAFDASGTLVAEAERPHHDDESFEP